MTRRKSHVVTDYFTTNFTPESSYILGLLWADGYVSSTRNDIRISAIAEDVKCYLPAFQTTGIWLDFWNNRQYKGRNSKPQGTLMCSNKQLKDFLVEHKYYPHNIESTTIIDLIPKNLQHYWYRGFVDGDGCWTHSQTSRVLPSENINTFTNRKFVITGALEQDWSFFSNLLDNLETNYKINRYNKVNRYSHLTMTGKENFRKLGKYLYQGHPNDQIGLPRKHQKYLGIIS